MLDETQELRPSKERKVEAERAHELCVCVWGGVMMIAPRSNSEERDIFENNVLLKKQN